LEAVEVVPEDNPVPPSGVIPVAIRKRKFISAALVVVCVSFVIGTLCSVSTTLRISSAVGANQSLDSNSRGLIPPAEKMVVQSDQQAGSHKVVAAKSPTEKSICGPELPYEDIGACPFEGCTYRCWTANKDTIIKSGNDASSPALFTVKKGEQVVGVTGTVITSKAGRARVLKNMDLAGVKANTGQIIYLLTYLGEGYYKAWYGGEIIDGVDMKFKLIEKPEYTWWVLIEEKNGKSGWSNQPENFNHKDRFE
jgi:hypothetical protein